jgi:hypothetical protein
VQIKFRGCAGTASTCLFLRSFLFLGIAENREGAIPGSHVGGCPGAGEIEKAKAVFSAGQRMGREYFRGRLERALPLTRPEAIVDECRRSCASPPVSKTRTRRRRCDKSLLASPAGNSVSLSFRLRRTAWLGSSPLAASSLPTWSATPD